MVPMLVWFAAIARGGVTVTLPQTDDEVTFDDSAAAEVQSALDALTARRFEEAGRRFGALADASDSADLRYLEAVADYEGGDLRLAERAAKDGLARAPGLPRLASLYGLILADVGKGDDAIKVLDGALQAATDDETRARILLNRGVVRLDRGEAALARADFEAAKTAATSASNAELGALATEDLGLVAGLEGKTGGSDPLGDVADKLRQGDIAAAKAAIPKADPTDRRGTVRALLATGDVARAEGRLDDARIAFDKALELAKQGGLVREQGAALAQLGVVYGLSGREDLALDRLQEAIGLVAGTSFKVNEVAWRVEAGRVAIRKDDLAQAKAQLAAAQKTAAGTEDPLGKARLAELEALIASRSGDATTARAAFDRAIQPFADRSMWAEAARIATSRVELEAAAKEPTGVEAARKRAIELFGSAHDSLGTAHVGVAEGLGRYRAGDLDGALRAFVAAADAADAVGTARGRQVAGVARQDAAQALIAQGHTADALAKAGELHLDAAVKQEQTFTEAEAAYDAARAAFNLKRYADARALFDQAYTAFSAIGETGYAQQSRRGRAWSEFDATVGQDPAVALPIWRKVAEDASQMGEPELRARADAAAALDASALGRPEAVTALRAAAQEAEQLGLVGLAGQVLAELADKETDLQVRAIAARRAYELREGDTIGTYAMYSVAVDAYNAEDYALALDLSDPIAATAGDLTASVRQVRDASKEALATP
jgi:tetratricopeptide (TPR) repeat protein